MKLKNPFVIGGYVAPDYFCGREREVGELVRHLTSGHHIALVSTRRMGKTGLIRHCFQLPEIREHYHTFFIDIYATATLRELVYTLGKEIFETLKSRERVLLERFFSAIASLRAAFRLSAFNGAPVFELGLGEIQHPETTLDEIFRYLESADKPCLVAIDEFQQIGSYADRRTEALLRTHIQHCTNTRFVFAGSQRHMMTNIFVTPSRPFYQSVNMMQLNAIPLHSYRAFVQRHFREGDRNITVEVIDRIYHEFEGHTWYMQMMFNELYSLCDQGEVCDRPMADEALRQVIEAQAFTFEEILSRLPEKQKQVLLAIARVGKALRVTSAEFVQKYALNSPSSVQAAIRYLLDKDLVSREGDCYFIYDRFFGLWLRKR